MYALLLLGSFAPGPAAAQAAAVTRTPALSPNPSSMFNTLHGVSALSATNAWAVGSYISDKTHGYDTLIEHWDGTKWSKVASPNPSATFNELFGVSAISATSAWAVGDYAVGKAHARHTLILHWSGTRWSQVASPNPSSTANYLFAVTWVSAKAWVVGCYGTNSTCEKTLVLHWNGSKWSERPSPNPSSVNTLAGVSALKTGKAWAVGQFGSGGKTLILHWNGTTWSRVRSPNPGAASDALSAVSALSATNAWAAGTEVPTCTLKTCRGDTLILHWNGTKWSTVPSPNAGETDDLDGVSAVSGSDAWAVGSYGASVNERDTLILHWNGTKWLRAASPSPSSIDNELWAAGAVSGTDAWAVGEYENLTTGAEDTLILHWDGSTWSQA